VKDLYALTANVFVAAISFKDVTHFKIMNSSWIKNEGWMPFYRRNSNVGKTHSFVRKYLQMGQAFDKLSVTNKAIPINSIA
jgi:hypothetical protein